MTSASTMPSIERGQSTLVMPTDRTTFAELDLTAGDDAEVGDRNTTWVVEAPGHPRWLS
jgi:hypothetical protein